LQGSQPITLFGSIEKPETAVPLRVKYFVWLT